MLVQSLAAVIAVGTALAPVAAAAPAKKPITKTYTASAPVPDATNVAGTGYTVCAQTLPMSYHYEQFTVPAAGTLKVTATDYGPDWDLLIMDAAKAEVASAGSAEDFAPETLSVKFKKATPITIVACNWAGLPTAKITYTFTFK